ncbi:MULTISPECIES: (2Fe-2S)-binding protein [Alteromonas]|uniref:Isoquinoline 1-oxidoreductase subunit alpha n=1 Tax=Alteromonas macleodii TaxID=28108 RepID=A0A6T9XZ05_ALTMA|nr:MULTISPECIES: (2Fe-2S)-binding protein [Alteromonas]TAP30565.1 (2Fe-2S)-binding protein [Alteromonas sp. KUL17]USI26433.1 (2Fe-2S)-binding protein [Alteromonas macleodii]GEA01554.1 oxidoreductase [Alteromonas sp. KUL17]CAB9493663.1 Isoquinoline 1-oxidoreductase subunit alpha [Alteromonas macleodii]
MMKLYIDGEQHTVDVEENMPLLWVLRDVLNKKGTKFGCGMGLCGACTVHVNGEAVRSCITPVGVVEGSAIATIESVSKEGQEHAIQISWREYNVPQCGYCQSGQIMSALSMLNHIPSPSDADIDAFMSGNICRCGTYPRIKAAIKHASKLMQSNQAGDKK